MSKKSRAFTLLVLLPLFILALYVGGRYFVFSKIEEIIRKELADLEQQGIQIQLDSLQVGPWQNRIEIKGMKVRFTEDYAADTKVEADAAAISIRGIDLLKVLRKKELHIRSVHLTEPYIQTFKVDAKKVKEKKVDSSNTNPRITNFFIRKLDMDEGKWRINDNTEKPVRVTTLGKVSLKNIAVKNEQDKPLLWQIGQTAASRMRIELPKAMYTLDVKAASYNTETQELAADSILMLPMFTKATFARKLGKEQGRVITIIPRMMARGLVMTSSPRFDLKARYIGLTDFWLESHINKTYPFLNKPDKELPVQMLRDMGIAMRLDTLEIKNGYVKHEEIPPTGGDMGSIFFNKIHAVICNIVSTKQPAKAKPMTMAVTAQFLGTGNLVADFIFPAQPDGDYYASGTLSDFSMPKVNQILEPTANAKIESGDMKYVKFKFKYNNVRSVGDLEMNYTDLKVVTFKKTEEDKEKEDKDNDKNIADNEKADKQERKEERKERREERKEERKERKNDGEKDKSFLKTFVLNTFIVKKNLDDDKDKEKRMGTIDVARDPRRMIFHYWWQSIFSGVLSVYNINKIPESKND